MRIAFVCILFCIFVSMQRAYGQRITVEQTVFIVAASPAHDTINVYLRGDQVQINKKAGARQPYQRAQVSTIGAEKKYILENKKQLILAAKNIKYDAKKYKILSQVKY